MPRQRLSDPGQTGSKLDWQDYAAGHDVPITADMGRDQIRDHVREVLAQRELDAQAKLEADAASLLAESADMPDDEETEIAGDLELHGAEAELEEGDILQHLADDEPGPYLDLGEPVASHAVEGTMVLAVTDAIRQTLGNEPTELLLRPYRYQPRRVLIAAVPDGQTGVKLLVEELMLMGVYVGTQYDGSAGTWHLRVTNPDGQVLLGTIGQWLVAEPGAGGVHCRLVTAADIDALFEPVAG